MLSIFWNMGCLLMVGLGAYHSFDSTLNYQDKRYALATFQAFMAAGYIGLALAAAALGVPS